YELPIALGKTITNEVFIRDLTKMPHLLVAGATGQGKSVGLNAIITSLLYKKHPSELKLVMVDPKKVEFSVYAPIEKHFLAMIPGEDDPIITDVTKVVQTLKSLCQLMDHRYDLLKRAKVRNIKEYNAKFKARQLNPENGHEFMPYIVVIIDEFGDLIMTAGKEVELPIARLAQLARAVGMHLIIATQRPTTNIITGTIKANFPARMAFKVTSRIDSQTILDRTGANQLVGKGDMLILSYSSPDPVRVQCAFVDTPEVDKISEYIAEQQGYLTPYELPEPLAEGDGAGGGEDLDAGTIDPLFEEAARLVVVHQSGSTSLIQRKFSIGYNRAGRLMDQLERAGIVGPGRGAKPREVLCPDEVALDARLETLH
ncbi:MAG: FtsK/SpoIIIE domain-containing protein, partial [Alloprevotella sp.]